MYDWFISLPWETTWEMENSQRQKINEQLVYIHTPHMTESRLVYAHTTHMTESRLIYVHTTHIIESRIEGWKQFGNHLLWIDMIQ